MYLYFDYHHTYIFFFNKFYRDIYVFVSKVYSFLISTPKFHQRYALILEDARVLWLGTISAIFSLKIGGSNHVRIFDVKINVGHKRLFLCRISKGKSLL